MKRSDIVAVVIVVLILAGIAYAVANALIGQAGGRQSTKVRTVEAISSTVDQPDSAVFNKDAVNPTVEVIVGEQDTVN